MIQINCVPTEREISAEIEKVDLIKSYFDEVGISLQSFTLFLRAFKKDQRLELWIRGHHDKRYKLLKTYLICTISGMPGPKRKEGDRQIPEGIYFINRFNPFSKFHLAIGLNYPNKSDLILGDPDHPGNNIFIHGNCKSVGCIAITDDKIKEVYTIARKAIHNGESSIRVEIFPFDFKHAEINDICFNKLAENYELWSSLKTIYDHFEDVQFPADYLIDESGNYIIQTRSANFR